MKVCMMRGGLKCCLLLDIFGVLLTVIVLCCIAVCGLLVNLVWWIVGYMLFWLVALLLDCYALLGIWVALLMFGWLMAWLLTQCSLGFAWCCDLLCLLWL